MLRKYLLKKNNCQGIKNTLFVIGLVTGLFIFMSSSGFANTLPIKSIKSVKKNEAKVKVRENKEVKILKTFLLKKAIKQGIKEPVISIVAYNKRLGDVLLSLGANIGYSVVFGPGVDPNIPIVVDVKDASLSQALSVITDYVNYSYSIDFTEKKIKIIKFVKRIFEIPMAALNMPEMSAQMGGDMTGGSEGGMSGSMGDVGGGMGSMGGEQSLQASVHLRQAMANMDGKKEFEENIKQLLSPQGHYILNWASGVLIIYDTPENISAVEGYIKQLRERADRIVRVEAVLMEVSTNKGHEEGIDWDWVSRHLNGTAKRFEITTNFGSRVAEPGVIITTKARDLNTVIKLISSQGKTKVLSHPYLYARNLQPVSLFSGKAIPYVDSVTQSVTGITGETNFSYQISTAQDGVIVGLWTHIRDDGKIDVQITPILSSVEEFVNLNVGGNILQRPVPVIQQTIQTVTVDDGSTIVIGGLKKKQERTSIKGIPLLKNIPILGAAFRYKSQTEVNSEFVITLKVNRVK